jgi:hypothetical protein
VKIWNLFLACTTLLFVAACTQKVDAVNCMPKSDVAALMSLKSHYAEADAIRDSSRGDHRLLGLNNGVGLMVPGLSTNPDNSGYGLRVIEGTDTPCSPEEQDLNVEAMLYAKKYNQKKMLLWQPGTK